MTATFDLTFDEAVEFFAAKGLKISPHSWRDVWKDAHARAFTVARVTEMDMLADLADAVDRAIAEGVSLENFKSEAEQLLTARGWFAPEGEPIVDETGRKRLTMARLDTIYRTNMQSAYSVGRYQQMQEVVQDRPYWQYKAIMDSQTRETHAAMNGMVFRADDAIWESWYPPNGFNCRCYVKTLSDRQVAASGLDVKTTADVATLEPDEGWDYHVGRAGLGHHIEGA